jgi:hypothetical protein
VVVDIERLATETENPDRVYYQPVQSVNVKLAADYQTAYFYITPPGIEPSDLDIVLPGSYNGLDVSRNIGIALVPGGSDFPEGQVIWIKVIAADESKTEYYKIEVVCKSHDTAITGIQVNNDDVLDLGQTGHIGLWLLGSDWNTAVSGIANLKRSEVNSVTASVNLRNNNFSMATPVVEYARVLAENASTASEPGSWNTVVPGILAGGDILAVRVTASNGRTRGYLKITVNEGGSPFLIDLKVNGNEIKLGTASADLNNIGGAYRVEDSQDLTGTPVTWAVIPTAADSEAAVSWALVAKDTIPSAGDFTSPASFSTSSNYLFIKVVSQNGDFIMYYLVIYDERPRDTERIRTGAKSVPVYRFTLPDGKTWGDLGDYPKIRIKIYQGETEYNEGNYHRNFVFGELTMLTGTRALNTTTYSSNIGGSGFNAYMPFMINRQVKDWAIDTPAPNTWYTIEWPLRAREDWTPPWDPGTATPPALVNNYGGGDINTYWPAATKTGDVWFGIGITHDAQREYFIKELSLVSYDDTFEVKCDLLGNGRTDTTAQTRGFVRVDGAGQIQWLRELVADPALQ